MERSELILSAILILTVAAGSLWSAHRIQSSQVHPVVVENDPFPRAGMGRMGSAFSDSAGLRISGLAPPAASGKRDVNRASADQLAEANGIGEVLSNEIVNYREQHGDFRSMEELLDVPGIGPSRLRAISELFDVFDSSGVGMNVDGRGTVGLIPDATMDISLRPSVNFVRGSGVQDERLDVNVASVTELMTVPGIGPVLAGRIVRYREDRGPFRSIHDLTLVSGIAEKRLESFLPYLRVGRSAEPVVPAAGGSGFGAPESGPGLEAYPPSRQPFSNPLDFADVGSAGQAAGADTIGRVNLNRATKEELVSLPGIGDVLAERIIADREANGPFQNPADIQRVSGIGEKRFQAIQDLVYTQP